MGLKICLDAGHYGKYNQSPVVPEYYESDMTWKLHLLLKEALEEYEGVEVITTRFLQDVDLDLVSRGRKSAGCDLFLSLHSNGVTGKEWVDYPVVYYPINKSCADLAASLATFVEVTMDTVQNGRAASRKSDNGNWDYYSVIYGATSVGTPGLIIEHSFHTNTKATNWLLQDDNLKILAEGEAKCIAQYYHLQKKKNESLIYRVQTGAFYVKAYAQGYLQSVRDGGFPDAYMVKAGGMYKIQVGAFEVIENAKRYLQTVTQAGFPGFITTESGVAVE